MGPLVKLVELKVAHRMTPIMVAYLTTPTAVAYRMNTAVVHLADFSVRLLLLLVELEELVELVELVDIVVEPLDSTTEKLDSIVKVHLAMCTALPLVNMAMKIVMCIGRTFCGTNCRSLFLKTRPPGTPSISNREEQTISIHFGERLVATCASSLATTGWATLCSLVSTCMLEALSLAGGSVDRLITTRASPMRKGMP